MRSKFFFWPGQHLASGYLSKHINIELKVAGDQGLHRPTLGELSTT